MGSKGRKRISLLLMLLISIIFGLLLRIMAVPPTHTYSFKAPFLFQVCVCALINGVILANYRQSGWWGKASFVAIRSLVQPLAIHTDWPNEYRCGDTSE